MRPAVPTCPNPTTVDLGPDWRLVDIDVAASSPGIPDIHGLTSSLSSAPVDLLVDEIRFQ